jgi:drug/metabolite transporter (DMT)-like permease
MLRELIVAAPFKATKDAELPTLPGNIDHALARWPEGYAYTSFCLSVAAAVLAYVSLLLLAWAYARAEAQHLAPVEYTAFIWAAILGFIVFAEPVRPLTVAGAAMIVAACLIAARRTPRPALTPETGP